MNRREFLRTTGLGVAGLYAGGLSSLRAAAQAKGWNILVITSDEHNPKILGCAGHPVIKTPAIDRLAGEGTMFTRAYSADPICAPTRQSLMTGNYPQEHGQFTNAHIFNEKIRAWGHHFKEHGYTTACIGKTHTNNEGPGFFGFDYRGLAQRGGARKSWDPEDKKFYDASPDTRFSGMILENPEGEFDGAVAVDSVRWLKENASQKFFLHSSFVKPHWPWDAPRDFYGMYDPARIDFPRQVAGDLDDDWMPRTLYQRASWDKVTEQMHRVYRARYYGSLSWLDSNVGKLLATLDELKLAGRTLVVYTTDHGDMAAEKGMWLKSVMFDASVRIPLLFRMPGVIGAGRKCQELINHVDLFPTIAGLAGAEKGLPANQTGRNFAPAVLGKGRGRDISFSVHGVRSWNQPPQEVMARSERWKFIWYPHAPQQRDQYVLYDMENDPDEITNVAFRDQHKGVVADHQAAVEKFLAGLKKHEYEPKLSQERIENKRNFQRGGEEDGQRPARAKRRARRGF
ncbi:MAG: sulfatase-like hydrolase/transferase [Acidobacteria bacterium]|nr:sulfatase-like hydrolase/transferase [Acidobacteriota bacterium]